MFRSTTRRKGRNPERSASRSHLDRSAKDNVTTAAIAWTAGDTCERSRHQISFRLFWRTRAADRGRKNDDSGVAFGAEDNMATTRKPAPSARVRSFQMFEQEARHGGVGGLPWPEGEGISVAHVEPPVQARGLNHALTGRDRGRADIDPIRPPILQAVESEDAPHTRARTEIDESAVDPPGQPRKEMIDVERVDLQVMRPSEGRHIDSPMVLVHVFLGAIDTRKHLGV